MRIIGVVFVSILMTLFYVRSAYAYLDPGTISMILQGIIGALAVALVSVKLYWYKLKSFFRKSAASDETYARNQTGTTSEPPDQTKN